MRSWWRRRVRRREELADVLLALAEALTSPQSFERRMQRVCLEVCTLLACDRSSIFLRKGRSYRAAFNHGNPPNIARVFPKHCVKLSDPLISLAVERRSCVLVNDVSQSPLMNARTAHAAGIRAIIVAPLIDDTGQSVGFMTAEFNQTARHFSPLDSKLVEGIAKLVAAAHTSERLARNRADIELERRARIEALEGLSGGLAHDLNNKLMVVIGGAAVLNAGADLPEAARDTLLDMVQSAEDAAGLVRELLVFAKRQPQKPEPLRLEQLLKEMLPALRRLVPENIEMRGEIRGVLAPIHADPEMMRQVILHLVLNACDAMREGGRLTLSLDTSEFHAGAIGEGHTLPYLRFEIGDTGSGIPLERLGRAFEPFGVPRAPGTGSETGLAFVHGAVTQAGGNVAIESEPNVGTTISVTLPQVRTTDEQINHDSAEAHRHEGADEAGAHVLVVDDDAPVRRVVRAALESRGYHVHEAATAAEAAAWTSTEGVELDLLVTDVVMPEKSGPALAAQLRRHRPDLLVLFITGYAPDVAHRSGISSDDGLLLHKPFTAEALTDRVAELLARRRARE